MHFAAKVFNGHFHGGDGAHACDIFVKAVHVEQQAHLDHAIGNIDRGALVLCIQVHGRCDSRQTEQGCGAFLGQGCDTEGCLWHVKPQLMFGSS